MKRKNQSKYSSSQKAKIALEAIKEEKTLAQIGSEYDVIPRNVFNWKKQALDNFEELFSNNALQDYQDRLKLKEAEVEELHKKIGELTIDLDWLKKKSRQAGLDSERRFDLSSNIKAFC